jgi:predicted N-acetyltransferase YhbS
VSVGIRNEGPADRQDSLAVERSAFGRDLEAEIVVAVRDEESSLAMVAEDGGTVVGHVQFSRGWIGPDGRSRARAGRGAT